MRRLAGVIEATAARAMSRAAAGADRRRQRRGISAGLRARGARPGPSEATLVVADDYPNFSICGIPFWLSGEVARLALAGAPHPRGSRGAPASGLRLNTIAQRIDVDRRD